LSSRQQIIHFGVGFQGSEQSTLEVDIDQDDHESGNNGEEDDDFVDELGTESQIEVILDSKRDNELQ